MNRTSATLAPLVALLLGGGTVAHAQTVAIGDNIEVPEGTEGYVSSASDTAVRTGTGECLHVSSFSEEGQINACEGIEEVVAAPAIEPEPAPAPEPIVSEPIVSTATLGAEALFDTDSAELVAASEQALADLLVQLDRFQEITDIEVVGHTDSRGTDEYNQTLSEQRARSVQSFLQAAYPDVAISARGEGESNPVATNSSPEGRQLNRRVEIRVTAKSVVDA